MEMEADIVIVGAGIAGLATATSPHLRVTGYAFTSWTNAWKALDALGIGDTLREKRPRQQALIIVSAVYGEIASEISLLPSSRECETRCLERKMLVEILANELPKGSIRFSSKVVSIEESGGHLKLIHLADGCTLKAKVLIGCDGVHSVVARWIGMKKPEAVGTSAIRGHLNQRTPFGEDRKIAQFVGDGVKYGVVPIDDNSLYWFLTFIPSRYNDKEMEIDPVKMKQFVLSKLGKGSKEVRKLVEKTNVKDILCSPLKHRHPLEALLGEVSKGNVCVAGDAFHPMTPDLGQGACSSLEDGVILARCLGRALKLAQTYGDDGEEEYERIKKGLEEYVSKRRWRAFSLTLTSYLVGSIELASSKVMQLLRDRVLAPYLNGIIPKMGEYDCGRLI